MDMKESTGPQRESTIDVLRHKADSLRIHAREKINLASYLDSLADIVEEINSWGSGDVGPRIKDGSSADHALYLLISQFSISDSV